MVNTAINLQRHTEWVSQPAEQIEDLLDQNGFVLVGDVIEGGSVARRSQGYVAINEDVIVVAFRGTKSDKLFETVSNIATDGTFIRTTLDFIEDDVPKREIYRKIKVHQGFYNEYVNIRAQVLMYLQRYPHKTVYVTGHSMGAALATLCSFDIYVHTGRAVTAYFFGSPRVGGQDFRREFEENVPASYRIVINTEPVPQIPGLLLDYVHIGYLLQLYPNGAVVAPDNLHPATTLRDVLKALGNFHLHDRSIYQSALNSFDSRCAANSASCPTQSSMSDAAMAERRASQ